MPTYQYACKDCGHAFEQVQSFSEDSLTVCPQCEGRLRKVFNAVGVVFKGSGFYRNDSRDATKSADAPAKAASGSPDKTGKSEKAEKKSEATTGSGSESSSSKPAAAKESSSSGGSSSAA